jgi:hypothetical protein
VPENALADGDSPSKDRARLGGVCLARSEPVLVGVPADVTAKLIYKSVRDPHYRLGEIHSSRMVRRAFVRLAQRPRASRVAVHIETPHQNNGSSSSRAARFVSAEAALGVPPGRFRHRIGNGLGAWSGAVNRPSGRT